MVRCEDRSGQIERPKAAPVSHIPDGDELIVIQIDEREACVVQRTTHAGLFQHEPRIPAVTLTLCHDHLARVKPTERLSSSKHHGGVRVDLRFIDGCFHEVRLEEDAFTANIAASDPERAEPVVDDAG
jgi:hypothetical protein